MNEILRTAINASLKAGEAILKIYEEDDFEVDFKSDQSPLTKADKVSHDIIDTMLQPTGIPVLSEEGKEIPYETRKNWDQLWIVDPIDGTKEFIKRNGEFTVNIALIENHKPVMGVVYVPVLRILYFASEKGSYIVEDIDIHNIDRMNQYAQALPIAHQLEKYTVVASKSHLSPETEEYIEKLRAEHGDISMISKGSSLKLCMVAEGLANCYPRFAPTMEWDTAAGQAICMYSGCEVIDMETKEQMIYNRPQLLNNWFLVIRK